MKTENVKLLRCEDFEENLTAVLADRKKEILPRRSFIVAAVLVPIYRDDGIPHVLLTKRSDQVEHHKGEISFPGGKLDDTDPDLLSCALRETAEEVGVKPEDVDILGELDDFYTVATNFLVVPFVGTIPYPYDFRPSAREIEEVIGVPLGIFFDPGRMAEQTMVFRGQSIQVISYQWRDYIIWGATARILKHFTEVVEGGLGRPDHCDLGLSAT